MLLSLSNIFSSISVHHLCCALRPNQLSKILPSLMLPSKICRALFQHSTFFCLLQRFPFDFWTFYHHRCYALRCSLQFPYILPSAMLFSKAFSSIFEHQRCYALRSFFSSAVHHLYWCYASRSSLQLTRFYHHYIMLCSKVFSPMFKHHRCYAIRLLFNFLTSFMLRCQIFWSVCLTFHHHGWYAIGTSLQFSNVLSSLLLRSKIFSSIF